MAQIEYLGPLEGSNIEYLGPLPESNLKRAGRLVVQLPRGLAETAAVVGTGIPAAIAGGLTGLSTLALTGGDVEAARAVQMGVADYLSFKPVTETGKAFSDPAMRLMGIPAEIGREVVGMPLESWKVGPAGRYVGEMIGEFGSYGFIKPIARGIKKTAKSIVEATKPTVLEAKPEPIAERPFRDMVEEGKEAKPLPENVEYVGPLETKVEPKAELIPEIPLVTEPPPPVEPLPVAPIVPKIPPVVPSPAEIVRPTATLGAVSAVKGPQNLVTYIQKNGFVRLGEYSDKTGDSWSRFHGFRSKDRAREMGDIAAVSRQNGKWSMDEMAENLNAEGIKPPSGGEWTSESLFDVLSEKGEGRNIPTTGKQDVFYERKMRRAQDEWEWAEEQGRAELERLQNEGVDPGTIKAARDSTTADLLEAARTEGTIYSEEVALKEWTDFLNEASKGNLKGEFETGEIKGMGIKDTFDLINPETEIGVLLPKDKGPGTSTLFSGIDFSRVKEVATSLYESVKSPPKWNTFMEALGKFTGRIQMGNLEMHRYSQGLKKRVPDKLSREAIINYLQADGDLPTLLDRYAKTKANPRTKYLAEGYAKAGKLTPAELKVAAEVREYFEKRLQEAIDVDMLDAGVENYITQLWDKENPITAKLKGEIFTGKLAPNPSILRKRIFESYFEGEQAGYKPKNKDVGFLLTAYDQAFNKAIASRAFIKSLNEKMATDGRPLTHPSGMGAPIPKEGVSETVLIKPRMKAEEFGDYLPINHPALRKWKWVSAVEGREMNPVTGEMMATKTPIYLQGDLLVHPEIYKHLKNVLGTSALRQNPAGKVALTVVQSLKGTLLSLSGFHQTHVAQHGATHKVNPFNAPEIDLTKPLTRSLIEHGVSVADHASMDLFSEGMASSGLINRVPGIGPLMQKYTEYLFKSYIPRLKMEMATQAYGRNKVKYGKELTDDQIQFLTGQQANAAFGELNYDMMGRNKTFQDVMRLALLAPDFLEARAKFVGQAIIPYGHEQFMAAAVRGALGMYAGARVINAIFNDGDPKWDKMFNIVIGGREYSIRSIQGDVQHLFTDPQSFVYHRLNPTTFRTGIEYVTKRDALGRYRDPSDQVGDFIRAHVPIPIQGAMKSSDKKIWMSMLNSVGITSYEARTAFDRAVQEEKGKKFIATPLKSERDRMKLVSDYGREYRDAIKNKEPKGEIAARLKNDIKEGNLYAEDLETIHSMAITPHTLHNLKQLSVEDIIPIWDKATPEEKQQYQEAFLKKIENLSENQPGRYKKALPELRQLFKKQRRQ